MNKKKIMLFGVLGLFAMGLVIAIGSYAIFSETFIVKPSVVLLEDCGDTLEDVYDGGTYFGEECVLTNNALTEREITISENSGENIKVSYLGELVLTKKSLTNWSYDLSNTKAIEYTIKGDTFEVIGIPVGYTLIYYPNTEGDVFINNIANVLVYDSDTIGNLPDVSIDVGDEYCTNGDNSILNQCTGAKLWLIEGDETTALAKLSSWNASEFYFETDLIQYNVKGEITLSPGANLTIIPVYEIGVGVSGSKTITTTIA